MYESVFYTVAPMVLVAVVAIPASLAVSICTGVRWFAERRVLKAAKGVDTVDSAADGASEA